MQQKENRGGKRAGAGRKPKAEAKRKTISITGSEKEIEEIKQLAEKQEKTVSRFLIESVLIKNRL